jgi:hypothetical protein
MAVWFIMHIPSMTSEQSEAVLRELGLSTQPVPGQLFHVDGPSPSGGTQVVDVWESEQAFEQFLQERLGPAFQRAGVQVPQDVRPQYMPVTHLLK